MKGSADFSTMPAGATPNCQSVVTEWRVQRPGRRNSPVDLASARELVRIDKPRFNHNGGALAFGPDQVLYISLGDGAGAPPSRVAVIGGYVYRGSRLHQLKGQYVFGDYSGRGGPTPQGHLFVLGRNNRVENLTPVNRNPFDLAVLGFAEDHRGELYLMANGTGTLLGTTGVVMKFVRARR